MAVVVPTTISASAASADDQRRVVRSCLSEECRQSFQTVMLSTSPKAQEAQNSPSRGIVRYEPEGDGLALGQSFWFAGTPPFIRKLRARRHHHRRSVVLVQM